MNKANPVYWKFNYFLNKTIFKRDFQFGYTDNHELLSGIAIWSLPSPIIFIFNSTSHMYSLIEVVNGTNEQIAIDIGQILNNIRERKLEVFLFI